MRTRFRLLLVTLPLGIISFFAVPPAHAVTTFCYTDIGRYEICNICEFIGPNGEDFGFVMACFPRAI